jgi:hemolysin III
MVLELFWYCKYPNKAFAIKSDNTLVLLVRLYMAFVFTTFTFSTLYHGIQHAQANAHLKFLISIYFLIAGTYIRFTYVYA